VPVPKRIIALAGTLCSPQIFEPLAERLRDSALIDAPSWMTSPGPWGIPAIAEWIAMRVVAARTGQVTVLGHSTGGAIALQLALEHPELIDSLVLIDSGPNMRAHGDVDAIIQRMEESWGPELFGAILDRSFESALDPAVRARFLEYANQVDPRAALDVLTSQRATDFEQRLATITCPVVVIHGAKDPTRSVAQAEEFAAGFRAAPLHVLPCGHSPMFELPDATARIIQAIL
jgi:pimeloyl-ACP methyl ester carboxylesterase